MEDYSAIQRDNEELRLIAERVNRALVEAGLPAPLPRRYDSVSDELVRAYLSEAAAVVRALRDCPYAISDFGWGLREHIKPHHRDMWEQMTAALREVPDDRNGSAALVSWLRIVVGTSKKRVADLVDLFPYMDAHAQTLLNTEAARLFTQEQWDSVAPFITRPYAKTSFSRERVLKIASERGLNMWLPEPESQ
ncbi:MAG: hypothetical protein Q4G50_07340 [Corynebacterium sp.]|uniref:hypothetical protein n=1 Tax=Corynebacterium sp. TaxID=1720 RepID=UPI0026DFF263|nr:hypothetical protein [Corynebacterium sp.]MDO5669801.1 hypothetical protein [Corynebacterium sp.]